MVDLIYGPRWFYGIDSLFETISILVSFLIAIFAYKIYKLTSQKKYRNFSLAFLMISGALSFKIISNFVYFYKSVEKSFYGLFPVTYVQVYESFNIAMLFLYRLLFVLAFLLILINILKIKDKRIITILITLSSISVILGHNTYFVFHLILTLFLGIISYHYFDNCRNHKSKSSYMVMLAFFTLLVSQVVSIFLIYEKSFYAIGESLQLVGFLLLLGTYITVLRK